MVIMRYDNEDTFKNLKAEALKNGCKHYFWASDDCYGFQGLYNGGTYIFFTDVNELEGYMKADALKYSKLLEV